MTVGGESGMPVSRGERDSTAATGDAWLATVVLEIDADDLVGLARSGDDAAFAAMVEPHRRELLAHAYRMLGSVVEAEDALQETLLAAWRGLPGSAGRSSLRTWLFTIATHACLRLASKHPPRLLSCDYSPARTGVEDLGDPVPGPVWLEPYPQDARPWTSNEDLDPAAAYLQRESVELAFVAALQHLPGTQRAVLLLRDVLGYSAAETAEALGTSVPSANSALQRARATLAERRPQRSQQAELTALDGAATAALAAAFVTAWERADVPALVKLLTADARFTMPPLPAWFDGRDDVAEFLTRRVFATAWRLVPLTAKGQLAFACYQHDGQRYRLGAVNVLSLRDGLICWIAGFVDPVTVASFGLPAEVLPGDR